MAWVYGSALVGLLPAVAVGRTAVALAGWFDGAAMEGRPVEQPEDEREAARGAGRARCAGLGFARRAHEVGAPER